MGYVPQKDFTGRRKLKPTPYPLEQRHPEAVFEPEDLPVDSRRGYIELATGCADRTMLGDRRKVT